MEETKRSKYRGYTVAQKNAHERYMEKYVEIKVRMTPEKRQIVKDYAESTGESVTAFINRAIDEAMANG